MKRWIKTSLLLAAAMMLVLSGCGEQTRQEEPNGQASKPDSLTAQTEKKLKVVATFYPMVEFSKQVAGEYAEVVSMIPDGVEPHDWEPSPQDMAKLKEADVFVYNGLVETWAEKALESAAQPKRIAVMATKNISLMEGEGHHHDHGDSHDHEHDGDEHGKEHEHGDEHEREAEHEHETHLDPHVWLSPVLAQQQVATIREALSTADPAHADAYKANADAYMAKLKQLDEAFRSELTGAKRKAFITQHAAFGYLAKEYGLTQISISGLSPEEEPSPAQMAEVVREAKEHGIQTIFFETLVSPKIAETIAKEVGAKTDILNPLEGLTDAERKQQLDYIGVMTNNLTALKKALNE